MSEILYQLKAPSCKHQLAPTKTARETASATAGITKPHTDRPGTVAPVLDPSLPEEVLPFQCLVREIAPKDFKPDFCFQGSAIPAPAASCLFIEEEVP